MVWMCLGDKRETELGSCPQTHGGESSVSPKEFRCILQAWGIIALFFFLSPEGHNQRGA